MFENKDSRARQRLRLQPLPLINRWCQINIIFVRSTEMKYVEYIEIRYKGANG